MSVTFERVHKGTPIHERLHLTDPIETPAFSADALIKYMLNLLAFSHLYKITTLRPTDITQIYLRDIQLTAFSKLNTMTNLLILNLARNKLTKLNLTGMDMLTEVDVSTNNLYRVRGLHTLRSLAKLDLSHNNLTQTPELNNLLRLRTLYLQGNYLTCGTGLEHVPNLRKLDISYNKLVSFDAITSTELVTLDLYYNNLPRLPIITSTVLKSLSLSYNAIESVQSFPGSCEEINIECNNLTHIGFLNNLTQLRRLKLNDNYLQSIPSMSNLQELIKLNLSNNRLTSLPDLHRAIKPFGEIDLRNNCLTHLPKAYVFKRAFVFNNPIVDIPIDRYITGDYNQSGVIEFKKYNYPFNTRPNFQITES